MWKLKKSSLFKLYNYWPPFVGASIGIRDISDDFRHATITLDAKPWNRNPHGTHYGGSIYSMTDPFYMLMLMENLGPNYILWDKAANIRFKKPGRGTLKAEFNLSAERIAEIKHLADTQYKVEPEFLVEVKDENGDVVAEVDKILYVRRKDKKPDPNFKRQAEQIISPPEL
ncbi:MAG: DUF4442 domain-containing protein [Alphaproteobacteria bacterium]